MAYSAADLAMWREVCARNMTAAGISADDMVRVSMGYGLFTGGLGWHQAAEQIGATIVPLSSGNTQRQIMLLQDFETTVICCRPSYAIYLAEKAGDMGVDLRYRTSDITRLAPSLCACGRTLARMERIGGRSDDMLIIRSVDVFPSQVETVLLRVEGIQPHYQIIVDRAKGAMDDPEVSVEVSPALLSDSIGRLTGLRCQVAYEMRETLGSQLRCKLVEPNSIEQSVGKVKRAIERLDVYA